MNRVEKTAVVDGLHQTFSENGSVILLSFKGVNVPDITDLRQRIRAASSGYEVVKNTLALRAAEGTPVGELKDHFSGPTAVAYTQEDPVALAKVLKEFVKANEGLAFKAGVVEGKVVSEAQVGDLADMPSRDELLSKLLYLLNAPLTRFATALKSPVRNLAVVLKQLEEKK
ncbi:MAG: 50S ribosomal protein L10 [Acidobacteriota bacterium]|nr:MAG: 50S ribosomal protein L10 [Acidobacteriota bacterium]